MKVLPMVQTYMEKLDNCIFTAFDYKMFFNYHILSYCPDETQLPPLKKIIDSNRKHQRACFKQVIGISVKSIGKILLCDLLIEISFWKY